MTDIQLHQLETKIEALLKSREQLRAENQSLRHKLVKLTQERADLYEKKQKTVQKIKRIIAQLRNDAS